MNKNARRWQKNGCDEVQTENEIRIEKNSRWKSENKAPVTHKHKIIIKKKMRKKNC